MANPKMRQYSAAIEGYSLIPSMDYVPFQGGMDVVREIYQLPLAGYSNITNFRPLRPGFIKRKGYIPLHTVADGSNKAMSAFMFSKGKQTERRLVVQMSDGDLLLATANPPTVTTGAFGSSIHTSASPATMTPASYAVTKDMMLYADGTGDPQIYSGDNNFVTGFVVYKGAETIPIIPLKGEDYSAQVQNDETDEVAILDSLSVLTDYDCIFIKTETPADTLTWVISALNASAAVAQMHYWNGTWTSVAAFTDNTALAGATLGVAGTMTWTMTTDHLPRYMFGQTGYWYRLSLSSGALDSNVEVTSCRYSSKMVSLQNVWDGVPLPAVEAYVYLNADTTHSFYASSEITIDALTSSDKFYINLSDYPSIATYLSVGDTPNSNATTMTVKYWNGSSFTAVANMSDGTSESSKSLAKDGWVTWDHPTDEQPTLFQSSQYFSYWYEISFSATLVDTIAVSAEMMPYYTMSDFGNALAVCPFKQRIIYGFEYLPGYVAISAAMHPGVLNGSDYTPWEIGDGRYNAVVAIKQFYNEALVYQEEKGKDGGCITLIEGYSPTTYGTRVISTKHGTFSSKSVVVVEDVPVQASLSVSQEGSIVSSPSNITASFSISRDGVYMCNGKSLQSVSGEVQIYFDPKNANCIRDGYEKEHWIDYDSTYQVIKVGLVTGSSATVPNTFLIYDIYTRKWYYDDTAQAMSCHCEVEAASGQFPLLQVSGGTDSGIVYLMNSGLNDNGTAITASFTMEFDGKGHDLSMEEMVVRVNGECTLTPYADGVEKTAITVSS